jgi:hypothetical protein
MVTLAEIETGQGPVLLRTARREDVPAIVGLIAADQLGATRDGVRDDADLAAYTAAFDAIDADPAHLLLVAESAGEVAGTMQLSFCERRSRRSGWRRAPAAAASARP